MLRKENKGNELEEKIKNGLTHPFAISTQIKKIHPFSFIPQNS